MVRSPPMPLTPDTLPVLRERVAVPRYDRRRLHPSIVHIGVGGFHRAHQAVYLDDLNADGGTWGEIGVGLLPQDRAMVSALGAQDGLYTLLVRGEGGDTARIVGPLLHHLFAPDDPRAVLLALSSPATQLVTMTITEAGYNVDETNGVFDATNEAVQADLRRPESPTTVFGYLAEALDCRRLAGARPFSVVSCDNVQGNGHVARNALVAFAGLRDDALANWIEQHVAFPNSMVDRITPQTTDVERALLADEFGIADRWPVVAEPFCQWVLEDTFVDGRPPYEEAGVQMVSDVAPYEAMKIRLLNGSHVAVGYLAALAGYRTVDQVMADARFREFVERFMRDEVAPLLPPVPGIDLGAYQRTLVVRFSNPRIADQVARICLDGSAKMPKFLIPSLCDALATGRSHALLTLALAGWLRYLAAVDDAGHPIAVQDVRAAELAELARAGGDDPRPLLGRRDLFGDLIENAPFVTELSARVEELHTHGAYATLTRVLTNSPR
jgi:mannitol 2-dehydrogenase